MATKYGVCKSCLILATCKKPCNKVYHKLTSDIINKSLKKETCPFCESKVSFYTAKHDSVKNKNFYIRCEQTESHFLYLYIGYDDIRMAFRWPEFNRNILKDLIEIPKIDILSRIKLLLDKNESRVCDFSTDKKHRIRKLKILLGNIIVD